MPCSPFPKILGADISMAYPFQKLIPNSQLHATQPFKLIRTYSLLQKKDLEMDPRMIFNNSFRANLASRTPVPLQHIIKIGPPKVEPCVVLRWLISILVTSTCSLGIFLFLTYKNAAPIFQVYNPQFPQPRDVEDEASSLKHE